jgi:hypothetical protein
MVCSLEMVDAAARHCSGDASREGPPRAAIAPRGPKRASRGRGPQPFAEAVTEASFAALE